MKQKKTKIHRGPVITIPGELDGDLKEFAEKTHLNRTDIMRAALRFFLPKLKSGEFIVVNGTLTPANRQAA